MKRLRSAVSALKQERDIPSRAATSFAKDASWRALHSSRPTGPDPMARTSFPFSRSTTSPASARAGPSRGGTVQPAVASDRTGCIRHAPLPLEPMAHHWQPSAMQGCQYFAVAIDRHSRKAADRTASDRLRPDLAVKDPARSMPVRYRDAACVDPCDRGPHYRFLGCQTELRKRVSTDVSTQWHPAHGAREKVATSMTMAVSVKRWTAMRS